MSKASKRPTRILFIGNSFTARNDLPGLLAQLAAARGVQIEQALLSIGGASLRTHWNKGEARTAIQRGKFDYVVLQEQSTLPIKNAARMRENVLLFDEEIRAAGAKTVLYMTWARKRMPEKQKVLSDAYTSIGREISAVVVPVGDVWWRFIAKHDSPALHDKDQSHPTQAGSYLAAYVFLATLFRKTPLGIESTLSGLDADEVTRLQKVAAVATT
jgi:hypothetical protein